MSTFDAAALRALLAQANATGAGPWRIVDRGDFFSVSREEENEDGDWSDDWPGELIVALLNAAPDLLDELDRLRAALATAEEVARAARQSAAYWANRAQALGEVPL